MEKIINRQKKKQQKRQTKINILSYVITSDCCPFQVEAQTDDGRAVHIRSGYNYFFVGIGKDIQQAAKDKHPLIESRFEANNIEDVIKLTKNILDFSSAIEFEFVSNEETPEDENPEQKFKEWLETRKIGDHLYNIAPDNYFGQYHINDNNLLGFRLSFIAGYEIATKHKNNKNINT